MTELLPCPFCGGEAEMTENSFIWVAICKTCGGSTGLLDTEAEAVAAWNTRAERTCKRLVHGMERDRMVATVSWTCSECGRHMGRDHNYCPNCGAKVVE